MCDSRSVTNGTNYCIQKHLYGVQGIATMVLESPFYGARKPHYQFASQLLRVSDLLTLGRATIEESLCLLDWAGRHGFARLGDLQLCKQNTLHSDSVCCV